MSPARAGLLVGLFALLLAVYFGLEWRAGRVEEREAAAKKVLDVKPEDVQAITLERPGEPAVRLTREQDQWKVVAPRAVRTDQVNARRIVDAVAGATRDRVLEGVDPKAAEYGLAAPALTVTLETSAGPRALAFGANTPVGGGVYAQRPGQDEVLVLPAYVKTDANQSLFDLRDKQVLDVEADDVTRLEVRPGKGTAKPSLVITKDGDDWKVEGTQAGREVDQYQAERVVEAATGMRMVEVVGDDPGTATPRGLADPARTVVLELAGGERRTVTIGDAAGGDRTPVRVEGDPTVYLVQASSLEALAKGPADLLAPPPTPSPEASASPDPAASPAAK
ncbi:MAG TPA: DUF4340 domain-containing protein [Thermodesulfobacteriota bacterium]